MAQKVDPKLAAACVEEYTKIYDSSYDQVAIQNAYTESVSFPLKSVIEFLSAATSTADTLEIKFGVYTKEFAEQYKVNAGRLTAFLYTTITNGLGDPPDDVYNVGDSKPPAPESKK